MPAAIDINLLQNVHLVPLTAYNSEGTLNLEKQTEHIQHLVAAGIRVFLPAAGTSEFHSLSDDEIVQLVRVTREATGPEATIFAPVGRQIGSAIKVGTEAMEAGADGVMFMPFEHPYLSDQGALSYYRDVMKELRCPVMIYKKAEIPTDNLLLNLARDPRMVGVKYAVNNMAQFRQTVLADRTDTQWLCGSAERFAPSVCFRAACFPDDVLRLEVPELRLPLPVGLLVRRVLMAAQDASCAWSKYGSVGRSARYRTYELA